MNIKTFLLYAGLACGGYGTAAMIYPSQADVEIARQAALATTQVNCGDDGLPMQRRGRAPIMSKGQGF